MKTLYLIMVFLSLIMLSKVYAHTDPLLPEHHEQEVQKNIKFSPLQTFSIASGAIIVLALAAYFVYKELKKEENQDQHKDL